MTRRLAPLALLALAAAAPQQTQRSSGLAGHDSNAPVDVSADHGTLSSRDKRAVLTGNVKAVQTDMTITSDRMTIAYADNPSGNGQQIQRIDASGNVFVRSPSETARSNFAIYDLDKKLITMVGGVVLNRNGNEVRSQRLVYDLNSGKANVDAAGQPGGRVTGHFTVPQKSNDTAPATKPTA